MSGEPSIVETIAAATGETPEQVTEYIRRWARRGWCEVEEREDGLYLRLDPIEFLEKAAAWDGVEP